MKKWDTGKKAGVLMIFLLAAWFSFLVIYLIRIPEEFRFSGIDANLQGREANLFNNLPFAVEGDFQEIASDEKSYVYFDITGNAVWTVVWRKDLVDSEIYQYAEEYLSVKAYNMFSMLKDMELRNGKIFVSLRISWALATIYSIYAVIVTFLIGIVFYVIIRPKTPDE